MNDVIKILALLVGIVSVLVAVLIFIAITLPSKVEENVKAKVIDSFKNVLRKYDIKLEVMDLLINEFIESLPKEGSAQEKVYCIKHLFRVMDGDDIEREQSIKAFVGYGRNAAFIVPFLERIKSNSNWNQSCITQYKSFLGRL